MVFVVVEEHLRDDVIGAQFNLLFQVLQIGVHVWGFEMFFGISGYADAEGGLVRIAQIFFLIDPIV